MHHFRRPALRHPLFRLSLLRVPLVRMVALMLAATLVATACSSDDFDAASATDAVDSSSDVADAGESFAVESEAEPAADRATGSDDDDAMADEEAMDDPIEDDAMEEEAAASIDDSVDEEIEEEPLIEAPRPQAGLLTAADIDDNLNFGWFDRISSDWRLEEGQRIPAFDLSDRFVVQVNAPNGVGIGNAELIVDGTGGARRVVTNSAGIAYVYPSWLGHDLDQGVLLAIGDVELQVDAATAAAGPVEITIDGDTTPPSQLDVALVLDVTGSMSDELRYLTVEFEAIIARLNDDYGNVDMRFALVVYRDTSDDFVTRTFDFTDNVQEMTAWLQDQSANGGGDFPEAMDAAMRDAEEFSWRTGDDVARVLILNADAPPHDENIASMLDAASGLGSRGVRIYPLAASGVDRTAEFLMRTMAVTTGGRHLFLTGDSGIGGEKLEPKAQCYVVTGLDDLLYRVMASELAGERIEAADAQIVRTVGHYDRGRCQ